MSTLKVETFVLGPFQTNSYLLIDPATSETVIVDPAADDQRMIKRLEGLKPKMIVQTHGHVDHCVGSSSLARRFGIPIAMHELDVPLYKSIPQQIQAFMGGAVRPEMFDLVTPEILLNEGDEIAVGSITANVIHLPGHSPGGIALYFQGDPGKLFCGDTLFADGVGRTDLWGGSWPTLLSSIRNKIFTLPGQTVVYSGHGPDTTVAREIKCFAY